MSGVRPLPATVVTVINHETSSATDARASKAAEEIKNGGGKGKSGPPAKNDPVIATVDGMDIHESEFSAAVELIPENMRAPLATPVGKKRLVEELIRMKLLTREAKSLNADDDPIVKARLRVSEENILSNAAVEKMIQKNQAPSLQDLYNRNRNEFETAKTRQIMVAYQGGAVPARNGKPLPEAEARAKAEQIAAKIKAGADFTKVAKEESDEPGVATSGGVVGDVTHGSLPPEVEKVLFSLPVNELSGPVKSQYAFHIFQVTGKETKTFDQVKPVLERQGQQLGAALLRLRAGEAQEGKQAADRDDDDGHHKHAIPGDEEQVRRQRIQVRRSI